jgi:hypothetical protein
MTLVLLGAGVSAVTSIVLVLVCCKNEKPKPPPPKEEEEPKPVDELEEISENVDFMVLKDSNLQQRKAAQAGKSSPARLPEKSSDSSSESESV